MAEPLIAITGPSGGGKGAVAFELAKRFGAEIVSIDSMKVYQEMEIGTAKPPLRLRREVRYHLIDFVAPDREFSVGAYIPLLERTLEELGERGVPGLLCGGTALYLKAFLDGLAEGPGADWQLRRRLLAEAEEFGSEMLHRRLQEVDPAAAARILPQDVRRIVRALEVFERTGRPLGERWAWGRGPRRNVRLFGIGWERQALYERTDKRVLDMVAAGLFEEAQRLRERRPPLSRTAAQCIGYKEIFAGLSSGKSRAEIVEEIQRNTRRFVKRQLTWFRKLPVEWIPAPEPFVPRLVAEEILRRLGREDSR